MANHGAFLEMLVDNQMRKLGLGFTPWTVCQSCGTMVDATAHDRMSQKHPESCVALRTQRTCRYLDAELTRLLEVAERLPENTLVRRGLLWKFKKCREFIARFGNRPPYILKPKRGFA